MKVIRKFETPVTETEDVFCNLCGNSMKSPQGSYYGLVEAVVTGGYESSDLEDGDVHKFSLCEACLKSLFVKFKYNSLQGNYLFAEVPQVPDFNPEVYWKQDKPAAITPEDEALLKEALEEDKTLIQNMNREVYDPFDGIIEDDDIVELLTPIVPRKKEDLN